jgi:hypothetical protein
MPAFSLSSPPRPPRSANSSKALRAQADPAPLPAEDLTAARDLVARGSYAQALVLAGALKRLHGPHDALTQIAADCRAHLDVTQDTAVAIDTGAMGARTPPLRRSG